VTVQHGGLTAQRWASFSFDQQILMIGNEMNRAGKLLVSEAASPLLASYERVLALVDMTVQVQERPARRRELLRWRDLIASLIIAGTRDPAAHAAAFRCLLRFTPAASAQIPFVLASPPAPSRGTAREAPAPDKASS